METRIIHNREVYINEDDKVIFDIDGKVPFNKVECIRMVHPGIH